MKYTNSIEAAIAKQQLEELVAITSGNLLTVSFEVGKTYTCRALLCGTLHVTIMDRTDDTIFFSICRNGMRAKVSTAPIEVHSCSVLDSNFNIIDYVHSEAFNPYGSLADEDTPVLCFAFAADKLYDKKEWEEEKSKLQEMCKTTSFTE